MLRKREKRLYGKVNILIATMSYKTCIRNSTGLVIDRVRSKGSEYDNNSYRSKMLLSSSAKRMMFCGILERGGDKCVRPGKREIRSRPSI